MDLIVFYMSNFDMILGIDFLRRNEAKIDYQHKKVRFYLEDGDKLSLVGGTLKA